MVRFFVASIPAFSHAVAAYHSRLEQELQIGPAFNGGFQPAAHVDFQLDEEQLLHFDGRGEGSSIIGLASRLQICEKHFDACWSAKYMAWLPGKNCEKGASVCPAVMCTSWLEANCMEFEKKCPQINKMCGFQAPTQENTSMTGLYNKPPEEPLVFLHIPKTAGTAIENAGIAQNVRWGRHRMFYFGMMAMPDGLYCTTHHVPPQHLPQAMKSIYNESEVFCVSRHPYERAMSEYKYLLAVPWGRDKPGLLTKPACSADGLNSFLLTSLRMVKDGHRFVNDCHMLPQVEFIFDGPRQVCKNVLRFEGMPQNFDALMHNKGYDIRLDHSENESGRCKDLTRDALNATTVALLNEIYDDDFKRFGYQKVQPGSNVGGAKQALRK